MIANVPRGARRRRTRLAGMFSALAMSLALLATGSPAYAQSGDPSKVGELTGNFDVIVWLLIPLALLLAFLTAVLLGPRGDPSGTVRRAGGVSRALSRAGADTHRPPS
jgi:hypothetical protein